MVQASRWDRRACITVVEACGNMIKPWFSQNLSTESRSSVSSSCKLVPAVLGPSISFSHSDCQAGTLTRCSTWPATSVLSFPFINQILTNHVTFRMHVNWVSSGSLANCLPTRENLGTSYILSRFLQIPFWFIFSVRTLTAVLFLGTLNATIFFQLKSIVTYGY